MNVGEAIALTVNGWAKKRGLSSKTTLALTQEMLSRRGDDPAHCGMFAIGYNELEEALTAIRNRKNTEGISSPANPDGDKQCEH